MSALDLNLRIDLSEFDKLDEGSAMRITVIDGLLAGMDDWDEEAVTLKRERGKYLFAGKFLGAVINNPAPEGAAQNDLVSLLYLEAQHGPDMRLLEQQFQMWLREYQTIRRKTDRSWGYPEDYWTLLGDHFKAPLLKVTPDELAKKAERGLTKGPYIVKLFKIDMGNGETLEETRIFNKFFKDADGQPKREFLKERYEGLRLALRAAQAPFEKTYGFFQAGMMHFCGIDNENLKKSEGDVYTTWSDMAYTILGHCNCKQPADFNRGMKIISAKGLKNASVDELSKEVQAEMNQRETKNAKARAKYALKKARVNNPVSATGPKGASKSKPEVVKGASKTKSGKKKVNSDSAAVDAFLNS